MHACEHIITFAEVNARAEIDDEIKTREDEQRVKLDPSVNIERPCRRVQLALGSKLQSVRGDSEIVLHRDARVVAESDIETQARNRRHAWRRYEVRIESAQREQKAGRRSPVQHELHLSR